MKTPALKPSPPFFSSGISFCFFTRVNEVLSQSIFDMSEIGIDNSKVFPGHAK